LRIEVDKGLEKLLGQVKEKELGIYGNQQHLNAFQGRKPARREIRTGYQAAKEGTLR